MGRLFAFLAALILLMPRASMALPLGAGASDPSIVIGLVVTLSGPGALAGQDAADGFTLALRQLGNRLANQEVQVVIADDGGSPDRALAEVRRLLDQEKLDMVLTAVSPSSLAAIMPTLSKARQFAINLNIAPVGMAGAACDEDYFDVSAPADGLHEALGVHLAAEQVQRLVVVGPPTGLTTQAVAALKQTFPGEVIEVMRPEIGTATFRTEIRRLRELKPDAVYSLLAGGMGVAFTRAYAEAGLKAEMPLYATWMAMEKTNLAALGDDALDIFSIGIWNADLDSIPNRRLITDFEAEHGRPTTTWAAQAYDAAFLLDSALKAVNGRTSDRSNLRNAIRQADFVSVRGGFSFNNNQFPVLNYYLRKVVRDPRNRPTNELRGIILKDWRDRDGAKCPLRWSVDVKKH